MTLEEHREIIAFIDKALHHGGRDAPLDVEADAIIRALFVRNPEAAYRVTRLAMLQGAELEGLQSELEARAELGVSWFSRLLGRPERLRPRDPQPDQLSP